MLRVKQDSKIDDQIVHILLKKINIEAHIHSTNAEVTLTQIFHNNTEIPHDTFYCLPNAKIGENIKSFVVKIDDQIIVELNDVHNDYRTTLKCNQNASSLKKYVNLDDNFIIEIGTLLPSKECVTSITYTTKLEHSLDSVIRLVIPKIIALQHTNEQHGIYNYVQSSPYRIDFCCCVDTNNVHDINKISSSSHVIHIELTEQKYYMIRFIEQYAYLDRDILIDIELNKKQVDTRTNIDRSLTRLPLTCSASTTNRVGQPFDFYCVLDFEAVCHQANPKLKHPSPNDIWEIIEFPICLLSAETNTIIDIYHSYVQPSIKKTLNDICISITGITKTIVDNSPTFDIVWKEVLDFLIKHSLISSVDSNVECRSFAWITCGNWDLKTMLPLQLKQSGFDRPEFINQFINIKDLYMEYYPSTRIRGMKDLLWKLNLKLEGRHHSGIDDTKNITKIAQWFIENKHPLKLTWKGNRNEI